MATISFAVLCAVLMKGFRLNTRSAMSMLDPAKTIAQAGPIKTIAAKLGMKAIDVVAVANRLILNAPASDNTASKSKVTPAFKTSRLPGTNVQSANTSIETASALTTAT